MILQFVFEVQRGVDMKESLERVLRIEEALCSPGGFFELEEAEVLGERMKVFKHRAPSLRSLLEASAGFGEKEYIVFDDRRITFRQHLDAVASLARALEERYGVKKGDRVAILGANSPEWITAFWAAVSLGAVAVGLNGWWVAPEILYGLSDSRPAVLIGDEKRLARLEGADLPAPVVRMEADFPELLQAYSGASLGREVIAEDDPACILYTSGTTGRPKGVVNSHRNVVGLVGIQAFHGLRAIQCRNEPPPAAPATLVTSPLFHVSGLYAGAVIALAMGIKSVWMAGRFDPVRAMRLIQAERVTNWGPMVTAAYRFVSHPDVGRYDLSSVAAFGSGGAPMARELQDRLRAVFPSAGGSAALGYGLTECTGLAALNFGDEFRERPEASGRPLPTVQIEIRDPGTGRPVAPGGEGEIFVRGPVVMLGYWEKPADTAQSLVEGRWLRTGDIGRMEEGHLVINSRARDLILRGAENIYPAEIEQCLTEHPGVGEAAVFGMEHAELGQEVKAVVVPEPGAVLTSRELAGWVRERLAYYKVPAHWEIREAPLPRNAVGKVLKHLLQERKENPFAED
jgi:acyl-CoA synthetase (AMP-forming)/AMP-acid ligase II